MGIAFAIVVVPIYLFVAFASIWGIARIKRTEGIPASPWRSMAFALVGFLGAVTIVGIIVRALGGDTISGAESNWGILITQLQVLLLGPIAGGAALVVLSRVLNRIKLFLEDLAKGALAASVVVPLIVPMVLSGLSQSQAEQAFSVICSSARIEHFETVKEKARSVAFLKDEFVGRSPSTAAQTEAAALFTLNQSLLEFVERPSAVQHKLARTTPFERIRVRGKRVLNAEQEGATEYEYEPITQIAADYVVESHILSVPNGGQLGLGGALIEIYRRKDNKPIAKARYYWSNKLFRSCPEETGTGLFVYQFITGTLNVTHPDGPKPVTERASSK